MIREADEESPSTDQRRERSRDAARCRRGKETQMFLELARQLPLPRRLSSQLDKATIMRLTLSFLRLRTLISSGDSGGSAQDTDGQQLTALDGFFMVLSQSGDIVFLCENVSKYLGLTQLELIGQSIFDCTHPCDHEEMRSILRNRHVPETCGRRRCVQCDFLVRVKCTLTDEGKTVNVRSASWKVLRCSGVVRTPQTETTDEGTPSQVCLLLICEPVPLPPVAEPLTNTWSFLTCHSLDMRFTRLDQRAEELTGYEEGELVGRSVYELLHGLDCNHIQHRHHSLFSQGQTSTGRYRLLLKHGGFIWIETDAAIIYSHQSSHPQYVMCVNYVLR
ncbi:hypoxia-inducible factor 1-alpha-like [Callorhinchus milii]|uniref:hypoxia-inducible factor 1-alpha-like n=1 Tax=Callorhinchus milii TaxID=7868 RepID=UPI001C3F687D|nr:hypoxia-inducible factor 1-alpha-like [Callorhinchus milii]